MHFIWETECIRLQIFRHFCKQASDDDGFFRWGWPPFFVSSNPYESHHSEMSICFEPLQIKTTRLKGKHIPRAVNHPRKRVFKNCVSYIFFRKKSYFADQHCNWVQNECIKRREEPFLKGFNFRLLSVNYSWNSVFLQKSPFHFLYSFENCPKRERRFSATTKV